MAIATVYPDALDTSSSLPDAPAFLGTSTEPTAHEDLHNEMRDALIALETKVGTSLAPRTVVSFTSDALRDASSLAEGSLAWSAESKTIAVKIAGVWIVVQRALQVITTGFTAETGWSLSNTILAVKAGVATVRVYATRTGANITVDGIGNFPDEPVATMPNNVRAAVDLTPIGGQTHATVAVVRSNGQITLSATAPSVDIPTGRVLVIGGTFVVAD